MLWDVRLSPLAEIQITEQMSLQDSAPRIQQRLEGREKPITERFKNSIMKQNLKELHASNTEKKNHLTPSPGAPKVSGQAAAPEQGHCGCGRRL